MKKKEMKPIRMVEKGMSIAAQKSHTVAMPLEQEVAKMKRMKMPIKGGATPVYGDEDGEVIDLTDFRKNTMDLMRAETSKALQQKLKEAQGTGLEGVQEGNNESKEGAD